MTDALRYEWTRLRTLRSTYWLIILAIVLSAAVAFAVAFAGRNEDPDSVLIGAVIQGGGAFSPLPFAAVFMAIIGIFATGHEYRHSTIQPTLTTIPQRSPLLAAKVIVVALTALVVTLVSMAINLGIGAIFWGEIPDLGQEPLNEALPGYVVMVVLWAILGLALAQLFRGVPSALTVILVFPLVVEGLIVGLSTIPALDWLQPVIKFLPFTAGQQLAGLDVAAGEGAPEFDLLDRWASGGVFAGFVAIILVVAWVLFKKRDA